MDYYKISDLPANAGVPCRDNTPIPYIGSIRPKKLCNSDKKAIFILSWHIYQKAIPKKASKVLVEKLQKKKCLPTTSLSRKWLVDFAFNFSSKS